MPKTQELYNGNLHPVVPFPIIEHQVGEVILGQGVYLCCLNTYHVSFWGVVQA